MLGRPRHCYSAPWHRNAKKYFRDSNVAAVVAVTVVVFNLVVVVQILLKGRTWRLQCNCCPCSGRQNYLPIPQLLPHFWSPYDWKQTRGQVEIDGNLACQKSQPHSTNCQQATNSSELSTTTNELLRNKDCEARSKARTED